MRECSRQCSVCVYVCLCVIQQRNENKANNKTKRDPQARQRRAKPSECERDSASVSHSTQYFEVK